VWCELGGRRFVASMAESERAQAEAYARDGGSSRVGRARRLARPLTSSTNHRCAAYLADLTTASVRSPVDRPQGRPRMRPYLRYSIAEGVISTEPGRRWRTPKARRACPGGARRKPAALIRCGIRRRDRGRRTPGGGDGVGDLAVLEVLYGAGVRVERVLRAHARVVDTNRGFLTVLGKGSKQRRVPLGEPARPDPADISGWEGRARHRADTVRRRVPSMPGPSTHHTRRRGAIVARHPLTDGQWLHPATRSRPRVRDPSDPKRGAGPPRRARVARARTSRPRTVIYTHRTAASAACRYRRKHPRA